MAANIDVANQRYIFTLTKQSQIADEIVGVLDLQKVNQLNSGSDLVPMTGVTVAWVFVNGASFLDA